MADLLREKKEQKKSVYIFIYKTQSKNFPPHYVCIRFFSFFFILRRRLVSTLRSAIAYLVASLSL